MHCYIQNQFFLYLNDKIATSEALKKLGQKI